MILNKKDQLLQTLSIFIFDLSLHFYTILSYATLMYRFSSGELDRKGKRKKIWKEWDKSTLCCTNWLDPLPGPTYEEEGPEVVGWFTWFLFNKSPSSYKFNTYLKCIRSNRVPISSWYRIYGLLRSKQNCVCLFFAAFVSQGIYNNSF